MIKDPDEIVTDVAQLLAEEEDREELEALEPDPVSPYTEIGD